MSIYSNVTEKDLVNLRKLAEQQKEQPALKIKNRILKQTHDVKLAESLSPITEKLDDTSKKLGEVFKECTQNLGNVIKENNTPQLAIENTPKPAIENTLQQAIENNEGVIYDVELENTLNIMKNNIGFFKIEERDNGDVFLNGLPVKKVGGIKIKINNEYEYNITPGLQKEFTDHTYDTAKSLIDKDKVIFRQILWKTGYYNRKPTKGRLSGRDRYIKNELNNDVIRSMNLDTKPKTKPKLEGKGVEKIIIPSSIIDIYTRLEVLLGLKVSGHTDTLTEASNLIDELYKRGEIQNKQQYRNALNKFST